MNNLSKLPWNTLCTLLDNDPEYYANKEFSRRVVDNQPPVVNYYLGEISKDLIRKINVVMGRNVFAEYYIFLSDPFDEKTGKSNWHRVSLYDARDCSLKSYTARIALRHFYKEARKEKRIRDIQRELIDYYDYESLLDCDQPEAEIDNLDQKRMKRAFNLLSERDKKVLTCLVIDKMSGIDAYFHLEPFVHPRPANGMTSEEIKSAWSLKQKQDVVSLMKGRALKRLLENYNRIID